MTSSGTFSIWQNCATKVRRKSASWKVSRCARSRRLSLSTSCTMRSSRWVLSCTMVSSRRCVSLSSGSSSSSSAAWLIADKGFRISCAMLAVSRPMAASFICWASAWMRDRSSRNTTTPTLRLRPTGTKRAPASLWVSTVRSGSEPGAGVLPPALQAIGQRRRVLLEQQLAPGLGDRTQDLHRSPVDLADHAALVHHQHAVLHVLDDQLIDLRHVGEIHFALRRQLFARLRVARQGMRQPGSGEVSHAEQPGLHDTG